MRRTASAVLRQAGVALLAGALLLLMASPLSGAREQIVEMKGFAFVPQGGLLQADVSIQTGDTVTWVYAESATELGCDTLAACPGHSSTSGNPATGEADGKWNSQVFGKPTSPASYPNKRFSVRFDQPGTYTYFCIPHRTLAAPRNAGSGMRARVVVQGEAIGGGGEPSPATTLTAPLAATGAPVLLSALGFLSLYLSWRLMKAGREAKD